MELSTYKYTTLLVSVGCSATTRLLVTSLIGNRDQKCLFVIFGNVAYHALL